MIYLDERIKVTIEDFSWVGEHTAGMYQYFVFDNAAPSTNLFAGNLYLEKNQYEVTVDITDIARNYCASTNKIVTLCVGIKFSKGQPEGFSEPIVPIYRYPNRKSDDVEYNDDINTIMLSGKSAKDAGWKYSNSLLPTYPNNYNDIKYLLACKTKPTKNVIECGTYSADLSNLPVNSLTEVSLSASTQTSKKWFDNIDVSNVQQEENLEVYFNSSNFIMEYVSTDYPYNFEFSIMNNYYDEDITTFPFSYTWSQTWENTTEQPITVTDLYTYNVTGNTICNLFASNDKNTKSFTGNVQIDINETFELPEETSKVAWNGWTFTGTTWNCDAWNSFANGQLVSIRFTNTDGDYVLEEDALFQDEYTWTWVKQNYGSTIETAKIIFEGYETEIPLDFLNNENEDDGKYRNVVFNLTNDNGIPIITVSYGVYIIKYTVSGTTQVQLNNSYSDNITLRNYNSFTITDYTQTPMILNGDAYSSPTINEPTTETIHWYSYTTPYKVDYKYIKCYLMKNNICLEQSLINTTPGNSYNLKIPSGTPINGLSLITYIFDDEHKLQMFEVAAETNKEVYSYSDSYTIFLSLNGSISITTAGSKFNYSRDNKVITIGKITCPTGYYLMWKDRLGSQQCQPFQKVDTYSEDITGSEITNYWGKRSLYKVEVQPKWKVQTGWISDKAYRCYEGLFVSPYVKLYDADSDIIYDVTIKDRNFTQKTFLNQGKLFNLEVTLEQTEKQNILY